MEELNSDIFTLRHATRYYLTMIWNRYDWNPRVHVIPQARLPNRATYAPNPQIHTTIKRMHSW